MKYFCYLLIICFFFAIILNHVSIFTIIQLLLGTIASLIVLRKSPLQENFGKYLVWGIIWISIIFLPTFHLIQPIMSSYQEVGQLYNDKLIKFGAPLFAYSSCLLFFSTKIHIQQKHNAYLPMRISLRIIELGLLLCITLTLFTITIGLGRMGGAEVVLPYHLSGIINIFRWTLVPSLFAIVVENFLMRHLKIPYYIWGLFILWCLLEIIAWMSKSVFVYHILPSMLVMYFAYKPKFVRIIKVAMPVLLFSLFLYPIMEIARNEDVRDSSFVEIFQDASKESARDESVNPLAKPMNRTFMFGAQFVQNYSVLNFDDIFDFSKVPILYSFGGAARYQTVYIDGYPYDARHSSGTSGLMDALLHGGIGLVYVIIALLFIMAMFVDKLLIKGCYAASVILLLRLFDFVAMQNISSLYDSSGLQTILIEMFCIYYAYKINYRISNRIY